MTRKTLIAVPCMDTVPVGFMTSLINLRKPSGTSYAVQSGSMIYDMRNSFVALLMDGDFDRVLFLDSDMVFWPDLLEKLSADMDETGAEYVSGLCFSRRMPTKPCVYRTVSWTEQKAVAEPDDDYPMNTLFECAGTGCAAVLISVGLIRDVWDKYGPPFQPMPKMGEDLSFCWRVGRIGRKMYCDSRIKVGHIGQMIFDESVYLAGKSKHMNSETVNSESGKSERG